MPKLQPPAAHVAKKMITVYGNRLHDKALCLTTPVPKLVSLSEAAPSVLLRDFLVTYEPRVATNGLYTHQADVVKALKAAKIPDIIMTTATGSGKSLAFWAWVFEILIRDHKASAILTFPTQALLWGQAKRLAMMSDPKSIVQYKGLEGVCFAGTIKIGDLAIPWSVWYGITGCNYMKQHQYSEAFLEARLRVSTLDKIHWCLMRDKEADFLSHLSGFVLDEAHSWHGLMGANVRVMIDRLRLSLDILGSDHPSFFLASATLAEATTFAESLTGIPASSFLEINDHGTAKASLVNTKDVPALLVKSAKPGLLCRYVLLIEPQPKPLAARDILENSDHLGLEANALCFVQSKFVGHRLRQDLQRILKGRDVVMYDADLPAQERRRVEGELFHEDGKPKVVVGTSALELGVDLPTLDVVVMDELPPRRCDLLQRLGRVGRSSDRPGLAILCLGYSPIDARLIEEPLTAVAVDDMKPLPLPLHLDIIRLRAMSAAFDEWRQRLEKKSASWSDFNAALERYFQWAPRFEELKERLINVLGDVVDLDEGSWYYKGFRVGASQGKRFMRLEGGSKAIVAAIEDIAIFRDAHPEGIYLGHRGDSYRIKRYIGNWDVGTWTSPKGIVLGKYMKGLKYIDVSREEPTLATRGRWKDSFTLEEPKSLDSSHDSPAKGTLTFGIFIFIRKFDGYQEIDLRGRAKAKIVTLPEIAQRFSEAVEGGDEFPFLHNFSYKTKGWRWMVARVLDEPTRKALESILGPLLQGFFCDAVECSTNDLQVTMDAAAGELRVVDATPGGNGLSEALLTEGRVATAWKTAIKQVKTQGQKSEASFRRYLAEECRVNTKITAQEIVHAFEYMASAWNG
ncbi:MAG: DEAD/DEAH box helicase [Deltaproteobacteria bacterium]|nr:DEAD/DEAH box helicase [Deltaproteobacteria bacterium]